MEDIIEKIQDFKKVLVTGIDIDLFLQLILHSTDGTPNRMSEYANNLDLNGWVELYIVAGINVNEDQVLAFFKYMSEHYRQYISGNSMTTYGVKNIFTNDLRQSHNFEFEQIVYYSINS